MRKLYALLTGLCIGLLSIQTIAQTTTQADVANFTFTIDASVNTVVFNNSSVTGTLAGNRRAFWTFGDGSDQWTGTLDNTKHQYLSPGTYKVCLRIYRYVTNANDPILSAEFCKTIVIEPVCRADFEFHDSITNVDPLKHLVHFWAIPFNNSDKPASICWTFGDGSDTCIAISATTITNPLTIEHSYYQQGPYKVCIRIKYLNGCVAEKCKVIELRKSNPDNCSADFERLPNISNSDLLTVAYKALPWHNNNKKPLTVCWRFGDGRDTCIKYQSAYTGSYTVEHRYKEPGQYEVCVDIVYDGGCQSKKCKLITITKPDSCSVDFETISVASNSLRKYFTATPWHNNHKKPVYICWKFGDSRDTCIQYSSAYSGPYAVEHTFNNAGQYEVCVRIVYDGGCESKKCKVIIIPPPHDSCSIRLFEITPSITSLVRGFYVSPSSIPQRKAERICWTFGDGTDTCIQTDTPNTTPLPVFFMRHTYPAPGVYKVCVKVLFHEGCIAYDCIEIIIRNATNICGGYMIDSLIGSRAFKFKGFSIHNPNDQPVGYRWVFGDGSSAGGQEVTHTYSEGGSYEACLYIKTELGCETRVCKTVRVPGNNEPALHLSPNPVINVLHVQFLSTHTQQVSIKIVNAWGIAVRIYSRNVTVGQNAWDIDLANLLPGVYSLVIQSPDQLASAIFLKQ